MGLTARVEQYSVEEPFYSVCSLAGVGIALVDAIRGTFIRVNSKFLDIIGYTEDELSHLTVNDITHPNDRGDDDRRFQAMIEGSGAFSLERRYVHKNGKTIWASLNIAPVRASNGKVHQVFGVIQDITESKMSEIYLQELVHQLRESEYKYRILTELCPEGIMVHSEGRVVFANPALARLLRAESASDLVGRSLWSIIHPDFHSIVRDRVKSIEEKFGTITPILEEKLIRVDGESIYAELMGSSISYRGKPAVEVIIRDISERKAQEREREDLLAILKEALKARDTIIGIASHELKTPLTALKLQMELANRLTGDTHTSHCDPRVRKLIVTSGADFDRLIALVDEMQDVSRISSGQMTIHLESLDLAKLTRDIIEKFGTQCLLNDTLRDRVPCDRFRYEQLLLNLLSNALKYGQGKPIEISLSQNERNAVLTVRDYGLGIAEENLRLIFKRFERACPQKDSSGLGLGLFIADQIVKAHQGHIRVESTLGKGSTFTVELPLFQKK